MKLYTIRLYFDAQYEFTVRAKDEAGAISAATLKSKRVDMTGLLDVTGHEVLEERELNDI